MKLTDLNSYIKKCGFPINSKEKYFKKIEELNLRVRVVLLDEKSQNLLIDKYANIESIIEIIEDFLRINIDNLSISKVFDLLIELQENFKKKLKSKSRLE